MCLKAYAVCSLAADAAFATSNIPPVPIPIPAPPFHDYQASVPLLHSSEARSSLDEGQTIGGLQFGAYIDSTMDDSAARSAFRQAPTPAPAPCISPDLVYAHERVGYDDAPISRECSPGPPCARGSRGRMRAASSSLSSSSSSSSEEDEEEDDEEAARAVGWKGEKKKMCV